MSPSLLIVYANLANKVKEAMGFIPRPAPTFFVLCLFLILSFSEDFVVKAEKTKSITTVVEYQEAQQRRAVLTSAADRYIFRSPDNDFTIQFPSKPQREEDIPGLIGIIRRYSSTTDTYYFGIVYQDVDPEVSKLKPSHEEAIADLLRERGHKIVSVRRVSRNITQMELWSPSRTPNKFLHRIERTIVSHDRMYTLGCGSRIAGKEVNKTVCRRFFNSFHIIGEPQ